MKKNLSDKVEMAGFSEGLENIKSDFLGWLKANWKWVLGIGVGVGITVYMLRRKNVSRRK